MAQTLSAAPLHRSPGESRDPSIDRSCGCNHGPRLSPGMRLGAGETWNISDPEFLALAAQVPGHFLEDVLEHGLGAEMRALVEGAVALGLTADLAHLVRDLAFELGLLFGRPF